MTMRRMLVMAGGAVVPIALISILLGNQWVVDAINETGIHYDEGIAPPLYWLLYPSWRLTAGDATWKFLVAVDLGTILFFVLLILLAVAGARAVDPQRGALGAAVTGWWATVVAGGVAGLFDGILINWALDLPDGAGPNVFNSVTHGASFGFGYGWLAGLGMLLGFVMSRGRGAGAQQQPGGPYAQQQAGPYAQQPYGQPMAPMQQQPMQQPMQQQAAPYVPPQGQPQQPWGGVPQQPMQQYPQQQAPQPYGAAPMPPQPPAQQPPQAQQPSVPQQPSAPPPEQAAPAEQAPPAAAEAPAEPEQDAPKDTPEKASDDAADSDDLNLADRTIVDRKRDGGDS
ncbi:hypothetical protein HUT06_32325 [Actinomadura sp. NAK00032]|uniref:hypothetical protein n=1 Tax=Actinomadura sp. NAK00032 TaxID=2742128 RepID=UPI001590182E|nr:hypothetical protein [Actinomadura sp. NAK00032]QKW38115.1 hypothetical protein HUT06_32325 [Actinomadura sp. NAK00032]